MCKFRDLRNDEIECRIATIKKEGCSLLLYKDARCDMNILDEAVGSTNWQREHSRDNANCKVSIWDDSKGQWISKEDTGTESYSEKEKGLASDSFKRACVNWGIGRELYTSPRIYIKFNESESFDKGNNHYSTWTTFHVSKINYDKYKRIIELEVVDNKGIVRFRFEKEKQKDKNNNKKILKKYDEANKISNDWNNVIISITQGVEGKVYSIEDVSKKFIIEKNEFEILNKVISEYKELTNK